MLAAARHAEGGGERTPPIGRPGSPPVMADSTLAGSGEAPVQVPRQSGVGRLDRDAEVGTEVAEVCGGTGRAGRGVATHVVQQDMSTQCDEVARGGRSPTILAGTFPAVLPCCGAVQRSQTRQTISPQACRDTAAAAPVSASSLCKTVVERAVPQRLTAATEYYGVYGDGSCATGVAGTCSTAPPTQRNALSSTSMSRGAQETGGKWKCCSCIQHACGAFKVRAVGLIVGVSDPPAARLLSKFTRFLALLFVLCVLSIIASPMVAWFTAPVFVGPVALPEARGARRLEPELQPVEWTKWEISWPPVFQLTAAALDATGDVLHVVAGRVLRTLRRQAANGDSPLGFRSIGNPVVLQEEGHGLGILGGRLVAIGGAGVYEIGSAHAPAGEDAFAAPATSGAGKLLDLVSAANHPDSVLRLSFESDLLAPMWQPMRSAAVLDVPLTSDVTAPLSTVVVVVGQDGGTKLCVAVADRLKVIARLAPPWGNRGVGGIHISAGGADEPLLWAADRDGAIAAVGLTTGHLRAMFRAPISLPPPQPRPQQSFDLRGAEASQVHNDADRDRESVAALTGNSTHLVAVITFDNGQPLGFSTPYPLLLDSGGPVPEL